MDARSTAARTAVARAPDDRGRPIAGPSQQRLATLGSTLNAAAPVQRLRRTAAEMSFGSSEAPVQRVLVAPVATGAAAVAAAGTLPNTDQVAPGPTTVEHYTATANAPAPNRATAITNAQAEYRMIGQSLSVPNRFLSEASLKPLVIAQRPVAAQVYDIFALNGIPLAPPVPNTPAGKQTALRTYLTANILTGAQLELLRNTPGIPLKDPVKVTIIIPYGGGGDQLSLIADFTEGQKGYISHITDTGANLAAGIMDRPNYAGEFPAHVVAPTPREEGERQIKREFIVDWGNQQGGITRFSNVHHTATTDTVGMQIGRLGALNTRVDLEAGADAITKVVAEGGRFNCVAALGAALRNDSIFYAPHAGGFRAIEFRELWKKWTRFFGGAYGIPDGAVEAYLTRAPLPGDVHQLVAEPAATGYNYNVNTSAIR